ncbi:MAG: hypothetical protein ABFS17_02090 [Chloroflexota bacterium]
MAIYKVSIVVVGSNHPGAIVNLSEEPKVGTSIKLGTEEFLIEEILELMPPKGDFYFLHLTCVPIPAE